jgi:hypothetical protein
MALILPSSSSQSAAPLGLPTVTFHGPDPNSQITATNPSGQQIAHFTLHGTDKNNFSLTRSLGSGQPPTQICQAERHSLSGNVILLIHNLELKLKYQDGESWKLPSTPFGDLIWRKKALSGGIVELRDGRKAILARGSIQEAKLEVFVNGDEVLLDICMATFVAMVRRKQRAGKESQGVASALDLVGTIAGLGGGGGGGGA